MCESSLLSATLGAGRIGLLGVPAKMTAGAPEMAGAAGRGRLRASHADRDQVIDALKAAYVEGRLTKDEFDARVSQSLVSRTYAELAGATVNLPATPAAAQLARKPERGPQPVPRPGPVIMAGTMLMAAMIEAAFLTGNAIVFVAAFTTLITYLITMFIGGTQMLVTRYERRAARPAAVRCARIPPPLQFPMPRSANSETETRGRPSARTLEIWPSARRSIRCGENPRRRPCASSHCLTSLRNHCGGRCSVSEFTPFACAGRKLSPRRPAGPACRRSTCPRSSAGGRNRPAR